MLPRSCGRSGGSGSNRRGSLASRPAGVQFGYDGAVLLPVETVVHKAPDSGQEAEGEPESPPPAAGESEAEPAAEPADDAPRGASDEVFIPTVEVQADEEVVFPVDI